MPVTQHPLHRSVRAELPRTAAALGHDDQTLVRVRVADVRNRQPMRHQAIHASPRQVTALAAAAQRAMPQPDDLEAECPQPRAVARHAEVAGKSPRFPALRRRTRDLPVPVRDGSARARGLGPRGVRCRLAKSAASAWPSAFSDSLGIPDHPQLSPRGMYDAARYPARAYPLSQRFAHTLTNVHA
jgi:hypothetical protein